MELYWHILDKKRRAILPLLKNVTEDGFYLAGGTALALQIGHRDSDDFDFFKQEAFDTGKLKEKINSVFAGHSIAYVQEEKNTLSCEIEGDIKLSFISHQYPLQKPLLHTQFFDMASTEDISCMKASAISGRAVKRDYVDMYFILQQISLDAVLDYCRKKYPTLNKMIILKSLSYFDDVMGKEVVFQKGYEVSWEKVKKYLEESVKKPLRQMELEGIRKSNKGRDIELS
jgi:Nucleotidyl transferase AbiEii toxin, Type IV TA system